MYHAYVKDKNIRFEYTFNRSYIDREKINRREPMNILDMADYEFKRMARLLRSRPYQETVTSKNLARKFRSFVYSEKDLLVLKKMLERAGTGFKNEDLRGDEAYEESDLLSNQEVWDALKEGRPRIWQLISAAKQLLESPTDG